MSIKLKELESIKYEAHLHWSTYIVPGVWAFFFSLSLLTQLLVINSDAIPNKGTVFFWTAVIGFGPIAYRFLQNKCKHYIVTNERLFVEEGILSKKKKDVPLLKINDLEVSQNIIQRIFGAGNISVLTGNDKPTVLRGIDLPDEFKHALSDAVSAVGKKAS